MNNASFNKMVDSSGPGSPSTSMPVYKVPGADWSPKPKSPKTPTSPISPSSQRPQFTIPLIQTDGPMYIPSDGYRRYFEPKLLVNKPSDELPPGVDPSEREVGAL